MSDHDDYRVLASGCGVFDRRAETDLLKLKGEDRERFLNGQVTCDVKALEPGRSAYGFFVDRQGKIQADVTVLTVGDGFWLELPAGCGEPIHERLDKYRLLDRAEIEPLPIQAQLTLMGPRRRAVLEAMGLAEPAAASHGEAYVSGVAARLSREHWRGLDVVTLWVDGDPAPVVGALCGAGATSVELSAVEVVRVEAGAPRFGAEFGPDHFPQETGLEDAVSYTKGCYLGQEVIARIHYRGGVNRRLCGLEFGGAPPLAGTELGFEGRPAGTIGTALWSPTLGRAVGLALLHRRAAATGTLLAVATGGVATVRDLPLVAERRGGGAGEGEGGLATR